MFTLCAAMQLFSGPPGKTVEFMTWNILGLPNDQVAVRPWEERVDGIARTIIESNAEIVVLQECFVPELSRSLKKKLENDYRNSYLHLEADTPLPSGLALFSKVPVTSVRFTPHPDLLDTERNAKMGTLDFVITGQNPLAHIAVSHCQGSSNCQWRVGLTKQNERLSYPQVREQEIIAAIQLASSQDLPSYVVGDLNVDRFDQQEYTESTLSKYLDPIPAVATNTCFWKHHKGISKMFPDSDALTLANQYKQLFHEKLDALLKQSPWDQTTFDPTYFDQIQSAFDGHPELWQYFKATATAAIARENELWALNQNEGPGPNVSIGRIITIRALPIEESLDYITGLNDQSRVENVQILQGYTDDSIEKTLSDHHPVRATLFLKNSGF